MLSPDPLRSASVHSALAPSKADEHLESTCPHAGSLTTSLRATGRRGGGVEAHGARASAAQRGAELAKVKRYARAQPAFVAAKHAACRRALLAPPRALARAGREGARTKGRPLRGGGNCHPDRG